MAAQNQLVDGSFMNTPGYNAGQAPVVTAPVDTSSLAGIEAASEAAPGTLTSNYNANYWQDVANASYNEAVDNPAPVTPVTPVTGATGPSAASVTNAMNQAIAVLQGYGLTGDIGTGLTAMLQNGLDATTIYNILDSSNPQTTIQGLGLSSSQLAAATNLVSSWQQRFVGNQARIAAGLTH